MILVVGGTGRLGSRVANRLTRRGLPVRVLSRGTVSAHPLDAGIETVVGDVRVPRSLDAAVRRATTVVSAVQGFVGAGGVTPADVDRDGNAHLVEAAERAGADVVLMSVIGAGPDHPMELMRMKYAAEQRLFASTCPWTVVRSEAFAQTWLEILEQTAGGSHRPLVFGDGVNPISWVDVDDVAALVERAVVDTSLRGRVLEIAGPESIGLLDLARALMVRQDWPGEPRRVPRTALRLAAATVGRVRPAVGRQVRAALAMDTLPTADATALRTELPDLPCTPVSTVVGRTPRATVS